MLPEFFQPIDLHWLRPWWWLTSIPALLSFLLLLDKKNGSNRWSTVIDSELLTALLDNKTQEKNRQWPLYGLLCGWMLCTIALAGPSFDKTAHAALKESDALVILLDLSPSMLASDIKPSRINAAHYKILDLLRERREGYTALVVYSGSAHVVTPLSDDTNTIAALVSTLDPYIMPSLGSRAEDAVAEAIKLLHNAHFDRGRLLLVTDGVVPEALDDIHQQLKGTSVELNVIGIGTADGAPVALRNGSFLKDKQGKVVMSPLDQQTLKKLATDNGGYYSLLRPDDADITPLTIPPTWLRAENNQRDAGHTIDHWRDAGYWLVLPCLLIALLFFRRGMVLCLLPLAVVAYQQPAHADMPTNWKDWWQTPDQQAMQALTRGDNATAAKAFHDPQWKAYAEYQNGQHKEAAEHFAASDDAVAQYNRGNAQARAGDLQGAIDSYESALKQDPALGNATFNRDLVKKLLEQKQREQKQQQKQQDQEQEQQKKDQQGNENNQDQGQQDQQGNQQQQDQSSQADNKQSQDSDRKGSAEKNGEGKQDDDKENSGKESPDSGNQDNETANNDKQNDQQGNKTGKDSGVENGQQEKTGQQATEKPENSDSHEDKDKQQATEQWLRKVPDDPGGLLRNKFDYYYQLNRQQAARQRRSSQDNQEEERW